MIMLGFEVFVVESFVESSQHAFVEFRSHLLGTQGMVENDFEEVSALAEQLDLYLMGFEVHLLMKKDL